MEEYLQIECKYILYVSILSIVTSTLLDTIPSTLNGRNKLCNKSKLYRFVDEIYQLHTGKYTRWYENYENRYSKKYMHSFVVHFNVLK